MKMFCYVTQRHCVAEWLTGCRPAVVPIKTTHLVTSIRRMTEALRFRDSALRIPTSSGRKKTRVNLSPRTA